MFRIADRAQMCSTLVIGNFPQPRHLEKMEGYKARLISFLKERIEACEQKSIQTEEVYWDNWAPDHKAKRYALDGYGFDDYAFVVGSIYDTSSYDDDDYDECRWTENIHAAFRAIGFTVSEPVHNHKNGTVICMISISVPLLLETLALYDKGGVLISLKKEKAA